MSELEEYRRQIDGIDTELAALFCRRMELVEKIALCKRKAGLPTFDPAREESMKKRLCASFERADLLPYYREFLTTLLSLSKDYQKEPEGKA
ncbi:MAG: chorismate mutase [Clostridia bacterium]|nr:chorismate mutase [Clostridia bacterium]